MALRNSKLLKSLLMPVCSSTRASLISPPLGEVERQFVNFIRNAAQVRAEAVRQDAGGFGGDAVALLFAISGNPFRYFVVVKFGRFKIDTVGRTF